MLLFIYTNFNKKYSIKYDLLIIYYVDVMETHLFFVYFKYINVKILTYPLQRVTRRAKNDIYTDEYECVIL